MTRPPGGIATIAARASGSDDVAGEVHLLAEQSAEAGRDRRQ